jgi:hypothetical protein
MRPASSLAFPPRARAALLALALGASACRSGPRREPFPTLAPHLPFSGLSSFSVPSIALVGEGDEGASGAPAARVGLANGYRSALPCEGGWSWGADSLGFVAVHRADGATPSLEVVFVLEQSDAMGTPGRKAAAEATVALAKALPREAQVGVVVFGGDEEASLPLRAVGTGDSVQTFVSGARASLGSDVGAGLRAAGRLVTSQGETDRRVVVVASSQAGAGEAVQAAAALRKRGARVSVVALGTSRALEPVARAGGGQLVVAKDARSAAGASRCALLSREGRGAVDAWLVAKPLGVGRAVDEGGTLDELRWLAEADPALAGVDVLVGAAERAVKALVDPSGFVLGTNGNPDDAAKWLGVGHASRARDFSGWRWLGENRHHARLRLGRTPGRYVGTSTTSLALGAATELVLGFVDGGRGEGGGLGLAMLCASTGTTACPAAAAFANFLAELEPPGDAKAGGSAVADGPSTPAQLARAAGFGWLGGGQPAAAASGSASTPPLGSASAPTASPAEPSADPDAEPDSP